jgi:hypothetical protein
VVQKLEPSVLVVEQALLKRGQPVLQAKESSGLLEVVSATAVAVVASTTATQQSVEAQVVAVQGVPPLQVQPGPMGVVVAVVEAPQARAAARVGTVS